MFFMRHLIAFAFAIAGMLASGSAVQNTSSAVQNTSSSAPNYTGCDHYNASNFFEEFDFFNATDPTNGFVSYQTAAQANLNSLAGLTEQSGIFLGVDYKTKNPPAPGRASVRVSSKKTYTQGLFIADIQHMPVGCGTWPALWTVGPKWPSAGEIDFLEGVNMNINNTITLHTSENCTMSGAGSPPTSDLSTADCGADGGSQGCSTKTNSTLGYGDGFNENGGGVYAMQWTSNSILVWFFPRNAIPTDASNLDKNPDVSPDVSLWGTPMAAFSGPGCDIDGHFFDHQIIVNTVLCGDWAGKVWKDSTCSALAPTCEQYVAENPSAFKNAYWLINSINVYQDYESAGTSQSGGK